MNLDAKPQYFKTFAIGRLYYRFIKGTKLEKHGLRASDLAEFLTKRGYLELFTILGWDASGKFTKGLKRYAERPGKYITKEHFNAVLLPILLRACADSDGTK